MVARGQLNSLKGNGQNVRKNKLYNGTMRGIKKTVSKAVEQTTYSTLKITKRFTTFRNCT